MNINSIKEQLTESGIFYSEDQILEQPTVIGYEKKFKWAWLATQLNTFIIATDFGDEEVNQSLIEKHLTESFKFTKQHYSGWPRGLQSGIGVISILISSQITEEAKEYCQKFKSGKKWAGFTIPVVHNSNLMETYHFQKNPIWGRIYYPHFKKLIQSINS